MSMKKIYFDGTVPSEKITLNTIDDLKKLVSLMDVTATAEFRTEKTATIKVEHGIGTSQFLSNGAQDFELLKQLAHKVEQKGHVMTYYVKLDGREVEI